MDTPLETSKTQTGLRAHVIFTIGALVLQYVLGMLTNMFVSFPDTTQPDQLWAAARSQFPSAAHILIGTLLLVSAIVFVVRAAREPQRLWLVSAVVGLIAILAAAYGGVMFTSTQVDTYSLVMALGFIVAFVAYGWGLYATRG